MIQSYSMVALSCMINLRFLEWTAVNVVFMSLLSLITLIVLLAFPIGYWRFLNKRFDELETNEIKRRHSAFYKGLDLRNGRLVFLQPVWFMFRRLILAFIVVFLRGNVIWQIVLMTMTVIT